MFKVYKYRLFTNANQERELAATLETHRRLYNMALDGKMLCWETAGTDWTYIEQARWFTIQRRSNKYFANLNSSSAQQTLRKLDKAFRAFFQRVKKGDKPGFPRFKGKDRFNSFTYSVAGRSASGCKILKTGKLRLQNIGTIRVRWHREIPQNAKIKQATITRCAGKWYVCFCVEMPDVKPVNVPTAKIGIDVGLTSFVTTSDGEVLGESRTLESKLPDLRRRNRALARCKRGSTRRGEVKRKLVQCHAKIKNTRGDIHHKVARSLVQRFGVIAAEKLDIKEMLGNRRLARRIGDAGWGRFIAILDSKASEAGCQVILVDPKNTTQMCSACGQIVPKTLWDRVHRCPCGLTMGRDENAAKNILAKASPADANAEITWHCPKSRPNQGTK